MNKKLLFKIGGSIGAVALTTAVAYKTKFMKHIIIIFCFFILFSCNDEQQSTVLKFKEVNNVKLSDIISDLEYIPLETNDNCYIGYIKQILSYQDRFYILDFPTGKAVYMFDGKGNYIQKIHTIGQGPGEYVLPYAISISETANALYLRDIAQEKMLVYDALTLDFKKEYKPAWEALDFCFVENNVLLYNTLDIINNGQKYTSHIVAIDEKDEIIDEKAPIKIKTGSVLNPNYSFFQTVSSAFVTHPYTGNVYEFSNKKFSVVFVPDYQNKKFPPHDFLKDNVSKSDFVKIVRESGYINFSSFFKTDSYYCSTFYAYDSYYMSVYNIERDEGIYFSIDNVKDDIGVGCFNGPILIVDDYCYSILSSPDIIENNNYLEKSKGVLRNLNQESNPVLLKYKLSF